MNKWKKRWATRTIPEDVREDLNFWLHTLSTYSETRLFPVTTPLEINWVGDASTSFGIGVLVGPRWCQLRLKEHWNEGSPSRKIAWLETVAIQIGVLMLMVLRNDFKGSNFIVYTDNTVTENTLISRKSRDYHSNQEWKVIQALLIESELDIKPRRVASADNIADGLSRGVQRPHVGQNRVWINIPSDLEPFMFHA
jgi:hypothetical protein